MYSSTLQEAFEQSRVMFLAFVYLLSVPVVLFILVLYCLALVCKSVVWLGLKVAHGRHAVLLPGVDAISQFPLLKVNEAANNVVVRVDGQLPPIEELRDRLSKTLLEVKDGAGRWKHPKLRQYFAQFWGYQVRRFTLIFCQLESFYSSLIRSQ